MKRINTKELFVAYLIRAVISVILYFIVKNLGLLDVNTVGLFAGAVQVSMNLHIPSIFAFFANLIYAKINNFNGTYSVTAALVDYFVTGGLFTIIGFAEALKEVMTSPEGGTIGGLAMAILPGAFMMMAFPFSVVLFIILLFFGRKET